MNQEEKEARTKYDLIASLYHQIRTERGGWFFNEFLEMPTTLSLLGNIKGKKILDFGCGTGIYAKNLTKKGAKVHGFDISREMLNIAKKYAPEATFKQGSGYDIPFNEEFDIVIASLVLDYFKDWNKVFKNVKRRLKKNGIFVFSIGNPVAECRKNIKYRGKNLRIFEEYFKEGKQYGEWLFEKNQFKSENWKIKDTKFTVDMPVYHKTYESVINIILKNGFEIVGYKDAYPDKKSKKLYPEYYEKFTKYPLFCSWKIKKK